jgi:hypothetical protein
MIKTLWYSVISVSLCLIQHRDTECTKKHRVICFLLFCFLLSPSFSQTLTLEDCIRIAQEHSPEAKQAKNNYLDAWYQYKLYKKSYLPTLSFSGTLPVFNRSISKITMPDGTEAFVSQSTGNYSGTVSLTQPIPFSPTLSPSKCLNSSRIRSAPRT